jgi:hypothetical protein
MDNSKLLLERIHAILIGRKFKSKDGVTMVFLPQVFEYSIYDNKVLLENELKEIAIKDYVINFSNKQFRLAVDGKLYSLETINMEPKEPYLVNFEVINSLDGSKVRFEEFR